MTLGRTRRFEVELPDLQGMKWVLKLALRAWPPLLVKVLGSWLDSVLLLMASSCIAYIASPNNHEQAGKLFIPSKVLAIIDGAQNAAVASLLFALLFTVLSGLLALLLDWTKTWVHLIINRRLTPGVLQSSIAGTAEYDLDAPTAVQRWLCKSDIVFFLTENLAAPLGHLGSIAIAIVATYRANVGAGNMSLVILCIWFVLALILTHRALQATKRSARAHEDVGREIRNGVSLRKDLSRPSLMVQWLERSMPGFHALQRAILGAGIWEMTLAGTLNLVSRALPLLAVLTALRLGDATSSIAILLYLTRLGGPLTSLANVLPWLQVNLIAVQRLYQILERYCTPIQSSVPPIPLKSLSIQEWGVLRGDLNIDYPDFHVNQNEILCVLGPSGSGKSSLLESLAGLQDHVHGRVLIDGREIDITDRHWKETRAFMPQETELIPGTIGSNLMEQAVWRSNPQLDEACRQILETISDGADQIVDIDDKGVSVGQRRALSFMRTLGGNAKVLLLDEPIAGIDNSLVLAIRNALLAAQKEGCLIIIAIHEHDFARLGLTKASVLRLLPLHQQEATGTRG